MIALILVGGEGTRLRPLTYDTPKPMLPIVERPIIARIVEWLSLYGIERAVLSLGYRPDAFLDAFPENSWNGVSLSYAVEPEPLDTAGAIRFAAEQAKVTNELLVIVNGDILTDLNLDDLSAFHRDRGGEATIALTPVDDPSAFGVVPTDDKGRVTAFVEKPLAHEAPTNLINAGTYIFEPVVLSRIAPGRRVSVEREVFPAMVADQALYAMDSDAYWVDTGSPDRYVQAQLDILRGLRPQVIVSERQLRKGAPHGDAVYIGDDVTLGSGVKLSDCVIGEGCVIGDRVQVNHSVLFPGVHLGAGVNIDGAIVGAKASVGAEASICGHSVIGTSQVIDPGTLLDSVRVPV